MLFKTNELARDRDPAERNDPVAGDATGRVSTGKDQSRSRHMRVDDRTGETTAACRFRPKEGEAADLRLPRATFPAETACSGEPRFLPDR